jgi:hypothetical protein
MPGPLRPGVGCFLLRNREYDTLLTRPLNLLELPGYGADQHTYPELPAAHDELIAHAGDRLTRLGLGDSAEVEARRLYLALAGSVTPLGDEDLTILGELAAACAEGPQPEQVPVRENRAVLNAVRLARGRHLIAIDTTTDVLRLAYQVSSGASSPGTIPGRDTPARLRAFSRRERRVLLAPGTACAARRPRRGRRGEIAIRAGEVSTAAVILAAAPGLLLRSADRLLRLASVEQRSGVLDAITERFQTAGRVSWSTWPSFNRVEATRSPHRTRCGRPEHDGPV